MCQRYGLSSGLGSTTMEGRRIDWWGNLLLTSADPEVCLSVRPVFLLLLSLFSAVSASLHLFLSGLVSLCRCVSLFLSRVSGPGRSCSTSVWSTHGCRTWTSAPAGSRPLCLHLCILARERRAKKNSVKAAARNFHFVVLILAAAVDRSSTSSVWRKSYWLQEAGNYNLLVLLDIVHP